MSLPRFIALESVAVNEFVYFVEDEGDAHGLLRAYGETIISPYAKFEVERARSSINHVNIRSCYNNKYWMQTSRQNVVWIGCDANEPQEDASLRTCTLFEPVFTVVDNRKMIGLKFAFDGTFVNAASTNLNQPDNNLLNFTSSIGHRGLFSVTDWESLYILPKYVAFKGDNGKFLSARTINEQSYLQFDSDDIRDPTVGNEVFFQRDGAIRLKSNHFGRFWRANPNWVWADSADTTGDNLDTVFWPNRVNSNVVAFSNLGNNNFCKRLTTVAITSGLSAAVPTIDRFSKLEVHESVLSRDISNVSFRLNDARIYGVKELSESNAVAVNRGTEPISYAVRLLYTDTQSRRFNSSLTLKLGVQTTIKTGIPVIAFGKITMSTEFEGAVEWGSTTETREETEKTYTVNVPPMSALHVKLVAIQGSCDVPFSYTQRDTLTSGLISTTIMNDGVYTGTNSYHFVCETPLSHFDEPLPLSS